MNKNSFLALSALFCLASCEFGGASNFKDPRDGKEYKTVNIGKQTWMAENLNFDASGSKCYENNPENCEKYGRLYDWNAAREACPKGWHLPSDVEWTALMDFIGDEDTAGIKLKASSGWNNNGNGTDNYGFAALPGGLGLPSGDFDNIRYGGNWWSATENDAGNAQGWSMISYIDIVNRNNDGKSCLLSVRCVKGNAH